ncbi:hypothetical protein Tco_1249767 [Tanacetum coccineum]
MSLSLAENVIVARANNRPPMLDKTQYSSWASCMLVYIKGKEHGKLLVDSVLNGPFGDRHRGMLTVGQEVMLPVKGINRNPGVNTMGQARVVKCYNCLEEEQLAFLADNGDTFTPAQASQEILSPTAFQADNLDAFDSDCDDAPSTKAILMANLSSYDSDVFSEMSSQVAKCNKVQHENRIVYETLIAELKRYKEQVKLFEQRQTFDLNDREKYIDGKLRQVIIDRNVKVADFEKQIHSLKLQLNAIVESHKTLSTTVECLKKESKKKEDKYLDEVIDLQKKNKALDNVVYKMGQSTQTVHMLTKP